MQPGDDVVYLSVSQLAQGYRTRAISPREAISAFLDRITALDGTINAFCLLDAERALAQATASEERFVTKRPLGPLDGVPVAVKDLLLTKHWPTRRGSRVIAGEPTGSADAPAVGRLRAEGAVLLGKTTTPEIGWKAVTDSPLCGVTRNPWNAGFSSGGSSGGSAAAVAAAMVPLALGTDGGGSIRIPSAFCGAVGFKPSYGLVAQWPPSAFPVLAHTGPIAWTVDDAAMMLRTIGGPDPLDAMSLPAQALDYDRLARRDLRGVSIAYSPDLGYVEVHEEVARAVAAAVAALGELGAEVTEIDPGFEDPIDDFEVLWQSGAARALAPYGDEQRELIDPGLVEIAEIGATHSAARYLEALEGCSRVAELVERLLRRHHLLVTPALPILGVEAGREVPAGSAAERWTSWTPFTYPFNMSRNPAITVPCGVSSNDLPIGLQIVGPRYGDDAVLVAAALYEKATLPRRRRPAPPGESDGQ